MGKRNPVVIAPEDLPDLPETADDETWWDVDRDEAENWAKGMYLRGTPIWQIEEFVGMPKWRTKHLIYGVYNRKRKKYKGGWKSIKEQIEERARKLFTKKASDRLYDQQSKTLELIDKSLADITAENPEFSISELDRLVNVAQKIQNMLHLDIGKPTDVKGTARVTTQEINEKLQALNDFTGQAVIDITPEEDDE